jgi:hypothetical protein
MAAAVLATAMTAAAAIAAAMLILRASDWRALMRRAMRPATLRMELRAARRSRLVHRGLMLRIASGRSAIRCRCVARVNDARAGEGGGMRRRADRRPTMIDR